MPRPLGLDGAQVVVAGAGTTGQACADVLGEQGARVLVVDDAWPEPLPAAWRTPERAEVRRGDAAAGLPPDVDLVVASPGWPPHHPLLRAAEAAGVPVWGEVGLAWALRGPGDPPWLVVTGTNGKTSTVRLLAAILAADGRRAAAVGNVGSPLVRAAAHPEGLDVLAVELSSFQLHAAGAMAATAAAVLNIAPDHLDWHGSMAAYTADKARAYQGAQVAAVHNLDDPLTGELASAADTGHSCRRVGFGLGVPGPDSLGVVEDLLVDRAFAAPGTAVELARLSDMVPLAPHTVANTLAAAALARAAGVGPAAVAGGLARYVPDPHRIATVAVVDGVTWVDDSKATNTAAAAASLAAFPRVVWVAGGLAKGASMDELVARAADRLVGVVLLGRDQDLFVDALARHAPQVPVVTVRTTDTGVMDSVVAAAAGLARAGDAVLLAPACASMDLFTDYADRGDQFAAAVRRLAVAPG